MAKKKKRRKLGALSDVCDAFATEAGGNGALCDNALDAIDTANETSKDKNKKLLLYFRRPHNRF
jgi:hypothetical protein